MFVGKSLEIDEGIEVWVKERLNECKLVGDIECNSGFSDEGNVKMLDGSFDEEDCEILDGINDNEIDGCLKPCRDE